MLLIVVLILTCIAWAFLTVQSLERGPYHGSPRRRLSLLAGGLLAAGLTLVLGGLLYPRLDPGQWFAKDLTIKWPTYAASPQNDPALIQQLAQQTPRISLPKSTRREDWLNWQREFRQTMGQLFQFPPLPADAGSTPTQSVLVSQEDLGGIRRVEYRLKGKGTDIPVILHLPGSSEPIAGVLVIPGHVKAGESGLDQLSDQQESYHNSAALRLAQAGFATLAVELRGFGRLGPPEHPEHRQVAYNSILAGQFYKALIVEDLRVAIDFLATRPEVDTQRLGITGVSLGGELAVAYAGLDERIRAIVVQSYGGAVGNFRAYGATSRQAHYCHIIPGSGTLYPQEAIFGLLAPRPTLAVRGSSQGFSDRRFEQALTTIWGSLGAADALSVRVEAGKHEYFVEPAVAFLRTSLAP